jgi:hypothetical protein
MSKGDISMMPKKWKMIHSPFVVAVARMRILYPIGRAQAKILVSLVRISKTLGILMVFLH